jgi:predicted alpha/beta hydrolase family esterase
MIKHVLFIQGAGQGAYEEDKALAESLRHELGSGYKVHYPRMPDEDAAPYERWKQQIVSELEVMDGPVILAGHSIGASVLAKCLLEIEPPRTLAGIFLIATPFWGGDGWLYEGYEELELPGDIAEKLPKKAQMFLYHCRDDGIAPFEHLSLYARLLPQATVREIDRGGHQLNNDLSMVAADIKSL